MRVIKTVTRMQRVVADLKARRKKIGFVPTMGYFHDGHLSLMRRARSENDVVVVSIFVNPKQFGPREDLAKYPRDFRRDEIFAKKENVDIIFYPSAVEMYPTRYLTYVDVAEVSNGLCGRFRPGHFRGVATVVAKLLNIVRPDVMYLGQKDAQQVVVLTTMVRDLNVPVRVKVLPTVREADGLAMSSRNKYLTPDRRREAVVLYRALTQAKLTIASGERNAARIRRQIIASVTAHSRGRVQYVACVDAGTLRPLTIVSGHVLIALAVWFHKTRLIDNIVVHV